jgi:RNA polymerase sigma-70 factor (family 1)
MTMTSPTRHNEAILLEKLKIGDTVAYRIIFETWWYELYKYTVKKIRSKEDAQEIVQNLFLELWEEREKLVNINLSHFLKVCVRNKCVDYIRKKVVEGKYTHHCKLYAEIADAEMQSIYLEDITSQVDIGLNHLPVKSQLVFRLSRFEGYSNKEIADKIHLSEKTVEYHLTKALKVMRVRLKDYVLGSIAFFYF